MMSQKKSVLVTGCNSKFGTEIAKTLAKSGHTVFATLGDLKGKHSTESQELKNWSQKGNYNFHIIELDPTSERSVKRAITDVSKKTEGIDVLVNCSGNYCCGLTESFSTKDMERVFDENVYGPQRIIQAVLPFMRKQGMGLILNVCSSFSRIPSPFSGVYGASKAAFRTLTESYRQELASLGIEVVTIETGTYPTDQWEKNLKLQNQKVTKEYGQIEQNLKQYTAKYESDFRNGKGIYAQFPQQIADSIKTVIDMPSGKRPMCYVADKSSNSREFETMNKSCEKACQQHINDMGWKDMTRYKESTTWNA